MRQSCPRFLISEAVLERAQSIIRVLQRRTKSPSGINPISRKLPTKALCLKRYALNFVPLFQSAPMGIKAMVMYTPECGGETPTSNDRGFAMATVLRTIEFLLLGLWLGGDVFLSFVVAPGAFSVLSSRDQAGAIVGYSLGRMHLAGIVCGLLLLVVRLLRTRTFATLVTPAALCVVAMIAVTAISQYTVSARMAALRVQMGSIQATAAESPLLAEFARLHRVSVSLERAVLLAGCAATYLMVSELR